MRVALLMSGQIRNAKQCFPSLDKFILQKYSPDVFVETWYPGSGIKSWSAGTPTDSLTVDELVSLFNPKSISIEDFHGEISSKIQSLTEKIPINGNIPKNVYSMHYKLYKCFQLLSGYCQYDKNYYDHIIRLRFDLEFSSFPILEELNNEEIHIPQGWDWFSGTNDLMAIGNYKNIKKYCELYLKFFDYVRLGISTHPETLLRTHLELEGIDVSRFFLNYNLGTAKRNLNEEVVTDPLFYIPAHEILRRALHTRN